MPMLQRVELHVMIQLVMEIAIGRDTIDRGSQAIPQGVVE